MKYIQKREEPKEFLHWKNLQNSIGFDYKYDYGSLQNPQKRIVHSALLREQGYICCYCCMRIVRNSSHIEHFIPQSTDSDLSVDYTNMLASCGSLEHWPKYCGNKRKNFTILISPLQEDCEEFFTYSGDGEILATEAPDKQVAAVQTISTLGLNDYDLRQMRIEVLNTLEGITEDEAHQLAEGYQQLDILGQYQPFCMTVLYFLEQYYGA